jgi:hypothetical protein
LFRCHPQRRCRCRSSPSRPFSTTVPTSGPRPCSTFSWISWKNTKAELFSQMFWAFMVSAVFNCEARMSGFEGDFNF